MKTTEINQSIIGKRCECMFTGMMVKGIITEIEDCKYSVNVKVVFDSPQQWGDDMYEHDWTWGRKSDEFGPLKYLKIIECRWAEFPPTTFYSELQAAQKVAKIHKLNNINYIDILKYRNTIYICVIKNKT